MFKMGCSMAKKILAIDGKSGNSADSSGSKKSKEKGNSSSCGDQQQGGAGGSSGKGKSEELNDFSKLDDDPRIPLNVRQIFKITKSWKAIARTMSRTGTAMFLNLFEQNQDLFSLFTRFQHLKGRELHESMELREHAATVMSTLDQSINSLSDYDNFVTYLHTIGKLHRKVPGFKREHFWKIEQPFLKAVKQTLDERCNETIEEIYKIAIKLIIETIAEGYGPEGSKEESASSAGMQPPAAGETNGGGSGGDGSGKPAPGGDQSNGERDKGAHSAQGGGKQPTGRGHHIQGGSATSAADCQLPAASAELIMLAAPIDDDDARAIKSRDEELGPRLAGNRWHSAEGAERAAVEPEPEVAAVTTGGGAQQAAAAATADQIQANDAKNGGYKMSETLIALRELLALLVAQKAKSSAAANNIESGKLQIGKQEEEEEEENLSKQQPAKRQGGHFDEGEICKERAANGACCCCRHCDGCTGSEGLINCDPFDKITTNKSSTDTNTNNKENGDNNNNKEGNMNSSFEDGKSLPLSSDCCLLEGEQIVIINNNNNLTHKFDGLDSLKLGATGAKQHPRDEDDDDDNKQIDDHSECNSLGLTNGNGNNNNNRCQMRSLPSLYNHDQFWAKETKGLSHSAQLSDELKQQQQQQNDDANVNKSNTKTNTWANNNNNITGFGCPLAAAVATCSEPSEDYHCQSDALQSSTPPSECSRRVSDKSQHQNEAKQTIWLRVKRALSKRRVGSRNHKARLEAPITSNSAVLKDSGSCNRNKIISKRNNGKQTITSRATIHKEEEEGGENRSKHKFLLTTDPGDLCELIKMLMLTVAAKDGNRLQVSNNSQ